MKAQISAVVALTLALGTTGMHANAQVTTCAEPAPGGEWPMYSHDLDGSRHQDAPTAIGPERAANLAPVWTFNSSVAGGSGDFNNTPAVADGCIYLAASSGWVFALNAETGELVWKAETPHAIGGSPAVADGRIYLHMNRRNSTHVIALDQDTGSLVWTSDVLDTQNGTEIISSPIVFNGMVFSGVSGAGAEAGTTLTGNPDSRLFFRGTYSILDAATGAILHKGYTIPDDDFAGGWTGGGIWSSPAVDLETGHAYVGSGNPFSPNEHENTNAILKIDVDRSRPTFGEIVDVYHGTYDLYVRGLSYKPHCDAYVDVFICETSDFDFGASPQLFTDADGRKLVGALQKVSIYHAAERDTMNGVWQTTVGGPFGWLGGMSTASFDGERIFAGGSSPGLLGALDAGTGAADWIMPIADGIHFQAITTGGGVTYTQDTKGVLHAWDSETGEILQHRVLATDTGRPGGGSQGGGIVVARDTVYVPVSGGDLIAYR